MSLLPELHTLTLDACLAEQARIRPHADALIHSSQRFSWAELEETVAAMAAGLRAAGLRPGGTLVAFPQRDWVLPVLFLATVRAGGVFAPLDARADRVRIEAVLSQGADLIFVPDEHEDLAERLVRRLGSSALLIRATAQGLHRHTLASLRAAPGRLGPSADPEAVCYINFTSGSTGLPKLAPTTHANIQWNTRACLEVYSFSADDRYLCLFAPFAHPHEHWARCVASGAACVMVEGLRPRTLLKAIVAHQVTWLFAIPTVFELLIKAAPADFHSSLRVGETGGAVVTEAMVIRAEAALRCQMLPIWGCTESTGVVLHVPPWEPGRRLEMLGKPVAHYDVRVHDPDPSSGVGELCVRGPAVVSGYSGLPDITARKFIGSWYHTGDLVREEAGGYLRFMGRQEEMIKVGGIKVYLREVEGCLSQLPQIAQVVVVSAQDPIRGEIPRAVIVLKRGVSLTTREIMAHCRATMRPEMIPRKIEIWDSIPTSPSGKVDRRATSARVSHKLALGVNSMLIADRPLAEVFRLAARARERNAFPVFVDLRSRRSPASDPDNIWSVAHSNADFDLASPDDVDRAVALSREHGIPIAATSAYLGACQPGDREYGIAVIDQAYRLAVAAPSATLTLRVLGGDLWARARGLQEPWHVVRQQLREESVETILHWEAHTRRRAEETGRKVLLGLELHHGQYLSGLHDIHHCCKALAETHWDFVGFLEDPCNRFIASEGDLIGAMDFARMVSAWGGRILGYHIKDVRYLSAWSQFHPQPLQRVGDPVFVWGVHKYAWTPLGDGEMDLEQSLMAARTLSQPPHTWCLVSSEYVRASRSEPEAQAILDDYCRLLQDGRPSPRPA